jgi:acetylornithine deacetylase/succinyl-diaminopimelate desuccinylase-like protein
VRPAFQIIERCRKLAAHTEEPGFITRTFPSEAMRGVHADLRTWMQHAGMTVSIDAVGNIRGSYAGMKADAPRLIIGSHLDTVRHAGAFDGVLGVVLGVELVELLIGRRFHFAIEVVGFSQEEGVRLGVPFIGSRALIGDIDEALAAVIGDPAKIADARVTGPTIGYVEFHIEQGTVLESLNLSLGLVTSIATTPMDPGLTEILAQAVRAGGHPEHRMASEAGHDAMIMARQMPVAMVFLRSPHGISHHPDESVLAQDVAAALETGVLFLEQLERQQN